MDALYTNWRSLPLSFSVPVTAFLIILIATITNVIKQLWFPNPHRPPVVFHIFPLIGSTVQYGIDPYKFFFDCQAKYGDCFTFILLGKSTTVFLGPKGNDFILNGKHADLNAEDVYGKLTTPVFGREVVYDCSNARFMDQKRLLKLGLTTDSLRCYIPKFVKEVEDYIATSPYFKGTTGIVNITEVMAEITIYTAAGSLLGNEVRSMFDSTFATLYRHLDDGFQPINFVLPGLPLPQNFRRDHARKVMEELFSDIIRKRREMGNQGDETDMVWTLMNAKYKDGEDLPDHHAARMLIAILMGGQHNTAASGAWLLLNLAHKPHLVKELYDEQIKVLGSPQEPLTWENLQKLTLNGQVIKETLRLHSPIHSILRQVKSPMRVPGTDWVVPPSHTLLASPGTQARSEEFFPRPLEWDPHRWDKIESLDDTKNGETVDYGFGMMSKSVSSPYLPFGAGRHRCVGENYAYAQLGAIIATFVRLLHIEQPDPKAPLPEPDYSSMFSRPMNPAVIRWTRRTTETE
ncbi:cytochrome P450 monooxygenase family 51 (sterol 14-demethylase) [Fusarium pseudoanthophilum]|uniref:Cytochrome P450 monooxygenase family 51 (Sterol 14-demethylase) n=1 Tax=Fusarium pseudoanthophilum TaxID=48495 RepID=A0A8H5L7M1_9HYPO|nr:cytochrome P450 monooxygenase family 51 (sterol 14-demethylase) [Fusarium pseudoanthophilum]